jgi:hypothetical protein
LQAVAVDKVNLGRFVLDACGFEDVEGGRAGVVDVDREMERASDAAL